jgi:hypothetical protein
MQIDGKPLPAGLFRARIREYERVKTDHSKEIFVLLGLSFDETGSNDEYVDNEVPQD